MEVKKDLEVLDVFKVRKRNFKNKRLEGLEILEALGL